MQTHLIDINDISIVIDGQTILEHASMHVSEGEMVYIIGAVGSGKSSLLKTMYAEMDYETGSVSVLDYDIDHIKRKEIQELRRQLGIVFQDYALLQHQTVGQNLDFVLRATGWKHKAERAERIREVLECVGLPDRTNRYPYELSGGEQQRIAIARAMLNSPRLILADEPTGNLDAKTGQEIMRMLDGLRSQGTGIVVVTHNLAHVREVPGRVYECKDHTMTERTDLSAAAATITDSLPEGGGGSKVVQVVE